MYVCHIILSMLHIAIQVFQEQSIHVLQEKGTFLGATGASDTSTESDRTESSDSSFDVNKLRGTRMPERYKPLPQNHTSPKSVHINFPEERPPTPPPARKQKKEEEEHKKSKIPP